MTPVSASTAQFFGHFLLKLGTFRVHLPRCLKNPHEEGFTEFTKESFVWWTPEDGEPQLIWQDRDGNMFEVAFKPLAAPNKTRRSRTKA